MCSASTFGRRESWASPLSGPEPKCGVAGGKWPGQALAEDFFKIFENGLRLVRKFRSRNFQKF